MLGFLGRPAQQIQRWSGVAVLVVGHRVVVIYICVLRRLLLTNFLAFHRDSDATEMTASRH